jgi:hypothetical protein
VTVPVSDLLVLAAVVALVGVLGVVVGMLVIAPRLTRLADRAAHPDEEPGDRTDG